MKNNYKYLIGSDPEIFIKQNDGSLSSAIGIFTGTKENPISIGEGCFLQQDNILVEFNIPPSNNFDAFNKSINYCKDYIQTILSPLDKTLHYSSSELASDDILKDPSSKVFGCAPSYNVVREMISDLDPLSLPTDYLALRSSGFHIHFGYNNPTEEMNDRLVMCFELFVTLYLYNRDFDPYNRRLIYGLIGDSRTKEYGVECRSLGGYFLKNDRLLKLVWDQIIKATNFADDSELTNNDLRKLVLRCLNSDNTINNDNTKIVLAEVKEMELNKILIK